MLVLNWSKELRKITKLRIGGLQMKTRIHLKDASHCVARRMGESLAQQSDQVGNIEFPNSCSPAVQEKLLRGVAMLHSFYYSATQKAFQRGGC